MTLTVDEDGKLLARKEKAREPFPITHVRLKMAITQAAPANARQTALPAHEKCSWGEAKTLGAHTGASKPMIIAVNCLTPPRILGDNPGLIQ